MLKVSIELTTLLEMLLVVIWRLFFLVLAYLISERILYASVSCMTKKLSGPYLISERILYTSVSYKRASTVFVLAKSNSNKRYGLE